MPYITRDDGEHFVIPSYRDVLSSKNKNQLKKDIVLLSQSYGEYITLQRKSAAQYEVAFSPDIGYLLGESIWHYFKRPLDMIYCEAVPNTTEAILVIVKSGSVYLDGRFPIDGIIEELVIFLTQQNNFEIYIYGDVPIAENPATGKFAFEVNSVKSFSVLDHPVFPTVPLLKIYQLQLVEPVLKAHGIGVFPTRQIITVVIVMGLVWMMYSYMTTPKMIEETQAPEANPYQLYISTLIQPAPADELNQFLNKMTLFFSLPGWTVTHVDYSKGKLRAKVTSRGSNTSTLFEWAKQYQAIANIEADGVYVTMSVLLQSRPLPREIYPTKEVLGTLLDRLASVYPGNHVKMRAFENKGRFYNVGIDIDFDNLSPDVLALIGIQFKDLPMVLDKLSLDIENANLKGTMTTHIMGS
jgi:hypothetical protein